MEKLYCVVCSKYIKFENRKISHLLEKALVAFIIYIKFMKEDEKIFKKEQ